MRLANTIAGLYRRTRHTRLRWWMALPFAATLVAAYAVRISQPPVGTKFVVTVNANKVLGAVAPMLSGSNVQWYSGENVLLDRTHPEYGVRPDVLGLITALDRRMLGFPGGRTSETYHWRYGVGPIGQRRSLELGDGRVCFPYFGTDEFAALCDAVGCEAKRITVNYSTGSPRESANWVEYCNASVPANPDPSWRVDSYDGDEQAPPGYFAWLRAEFGHPVPYNVRYWEIGNEVNSRYDVAPGLTPEKYAEDVVRHIQAMKAVDPTIEVGAVAAHEHPWEDWNERVLAVASGSLDYMAEHYGSKLVRLVFNSYTGNSAMTRSVYFPVSQTYTFAATMRAQVIPAGEGAGVPARMRFSVDGVPVHIWEVTSLAKQECSCFVTRGYHELALAFINDLVTPEGDRNVYFYGLTRRSASVLEENVWFPDDAEQQLLLTDPSRVSGELRRLRDLVAQYASGRDIDVLVTEGTMAYDEGRVAIGYPKEEIKHGLRFKAALWYSGMLNMFMREHLPVFCNWTLFDGCEHGMIREPRMTADGLPLGTPVYHTYTLYSRLAGAKLLESRVTSPTYTWPEGIDPPPAWNGQSTYISCPKPDHVPYLDAIAARDSTGKYLHIMVTNRSKSPAPTTIQVNAFLCRPVADVGTLAVWSLVPRPDRIVGNVCPELEAFCETKTNDKEIVLPDDVSIRWTRINNAAPAFTYTFRPWSITLITLRKSP